MYLEKNINALRTTDPLLAEEILRADEQGEITVIKTRNGLYTAKKGGVLLHSQYDPVREAERWAERQDDRLSRYKRIYILGFGFGYHVEALLNLYKTVETVVIEPEVALLKRAFQVRDLSHILKRVRIVADPERLPAAKGRFLVLRHLPSLKLNREFYERVEIRLKTMRALHGGLKISVVGPAYGGSLSIAEYTSRALKDLGHTVQYIDNSAFKDALLFIERIGLPGDAKAELNHLFLEFASFSVLSRMERFRPDLVIALAQAPLHKGALEKIKKTGLKTAFWFVENYRHLTYWKEMFNYYDYLFVIQKDEFIREIRENYKKPVLYLPLAALPEFHRPLELTEEEIEEFGSDLSFVGAGYRNRQEMFLGLLDYDFKIWGKGWNMHSPLSDFVQRKASWIEPREIVKIFNASKINLNLHSSAYHTGVDPFGDFINPRTFEIASTKAFQLVDQRRYLSEVFEIGSEVETFSSLEELRKKIDYYLRNQKEREEMAEAAYRRVLREHTYQLRLREMLEFIFEKGFDLPGWTGTDIFVSDVIDELGDDKELVELLRGFEDRGRVGFDEIIERIETTEGELSDAEKIFLFMREIKNQYLKV
ncbi:MAG: hypothetical protein D6710_02220 [Nitrospirae bacterium]|nr:MAG: hypothetical protein D6710_02220 [Nitrospirota bacterium]